MDPSEKRLPLTDALPGAVAERRFPEATPPDLLPPLLISFLVVALYVPALHLGLTGEDHILIQLARRGLEEPLQLFAPLGPHLWVTTAWTLAVDWLLWGAQAEAYHLLNVLLRCFATSWLLYLLARRLHLGPWMAGAIAALWACSPLSAEPVFVVGCRSEELVLLFWLTVLLAWPRSLAGSKSALVGPWLLLILAALSHEMWVGLPLTLSAIGWVVGGPARQRAARELPVYLTAGLFVLLYLGFFAGAGASLSPGPGLLARAGHQMAAFWQLEPLYQSGLPLGWKGVSALVLTAAAFGLAGYLRSAAGIVGGVLMVSASLPTLFVTTLSSRNTSIPFAGFLLLLGGLVAERERLPTVRGPRIAAWTAATVASMALVAGLFTVRADLSEAAQSARGRPGLEESSDLAALTFPLDRPGADREGTTSAEKPY